MKKKVIIGAVLFLLVFAGTALAFNFILNRGYKSRRVEASAAELPVLSVRCGEYRINRLLGYKTEVNPVLERDAVIPVGKDKKFTLLVPTSFATSEIDYELWDVTQENLIENGTLTRRDGENFAEYDAEIRMNLTPGREYLFQAQLRIGGSTVRYYSRVIRLDKDKLDRLIPYAENFSKETLAKHLPEEGLPEKWAKSLTQNPEENKEGENTEEKDMSEETVVQTEREANIGRVTFESDVYDVLYGGLNLSLYTEKVPSLREVSEKDCVISFRYGVIAADGSIYTVRENMTLEYDNSTDQVMLREYTRLMDAAPSSDALDSTSNSIEIGVASETPSWVVSKDFTRILYTANGTVWFYDYKNALITELFGTGQGDMPGEGYRVVPLYVDEHRADFMIVGRIPEGRNEGKNGVLVLSYSVDEASMSEPLLLETAESMTLLRTEVERFIHYDMEGKTILLLLNDKLMRIKLADGSTETLVEGIPAEAFYVSDDRKLLIYPDTADLAKVTKLTMMNMETGGVAEKTDSGRILSPIGFIEDCFIYGSATENHVRRNADGTADFYFSSLFITDPNGDVIKEYHKNGKLVSGVDFVGNTIYLDLVEEKDGALESGGKDYISYKPESEKDELIITEGVKGGAVVCRITFPDSIYLRGRPAEIMPTYNANRKLIRVSEEYAGLSDEVYRYNCEGLAAVLASSGAAIRDVNASGGYAIKNGQLLYRKKESAAYYTVAGTFTYENVESDADTYRACLVMALRSCGITADISEFTADTDWEEAFRERSQTVQGLNFSGADLDTGVMFLGDGSPFAVRLENRYVFVVSFNDTYIRYYDPVEKEEKRVLRSDFQKDAEKSGNEFYTWRRGG